jgi:hypothetical protein
LIAALRDCDDSVTADELTKQFSRAHRETIDELLQALATLGQPTLARRGIYELAMVARPTLLKCRHACASDWYVFWLRQPVTRASSAAGVLHQDAAIEQFPNITQRRIR